MERFKNKYRIASTRLQHWDYRWAGAYFITVCTQNREHYFGHIVDGKMQLSHVGIIADVLWHQIPHHAHHVELGAFVVMPNHIHGIVVINNNTDLGNVDMGNVDSGDVETGHALSLPPTKQSSKPSSQPPTKGDVDSGNADMGDVDMGDADSGNVDSGDADSGNVDSGDVETGHALSLPPTKQSSKPSSQPPTQPPTKGDVDSGNVDSGNVDSGDADSGNVDSGNVDSGDVDSGDVDSGDADSGDVETGHALSLPSSKPSSQPPTQPLSNKTPIQSPTIGQQRFQNIGKNSISSIVGSYKSAVTKHANRLGLVFQWQTRFHDHIIRDDPSFQKISEYIKNNPANWKDDKFHNSEQ